MTLAVVVALALFILLPAFAAHYLKGFVSDSSFAFVVIDGVLRIALIVLYIWVISRSGEIQRVFQYHGAEHKTIHAYEAGDPLTAEMIQRYSPRHPRCGTSFILIVGMVAFVVFLTLAPLPFVWQILSRIILIPVIAGLSYEVLKLGANSRWMSWANRPGIWLQYITTKEPSDDMVEVAVASLLASLSDEEHAAVVARGPIEAGLSPLRENCPPMDDRLATHSVSSESFTTRQSRRWQIPKVLADQDHFRDVSIRHAELRPVIEAFEQYQDARAEMRDATEMAGAEDDGEMRSYLESVASEQQARLESLETRLRVMLVPKDPNDDKDVILEIRAAAGGEEAALWGADLYRMYRTVCRASRLEDRVDQHLLYGRGRVEGCHLLGEGEGGLLAAEV